MPRYGELGSRSRCTHLAQRCQPATVVHPTWQREPLVPPDSPSHHKRCLSRGAPFMIYHAASRARKSIHPTSTTTASRARKSKVPRSEGAEPRTCSHFSDDSGLDMAGLIHSCVQRIASICHGLYVREQRWRSPSCMIPPARANNLTIYVTVRVREHSIRAY